MACKSFVAAWMLVVVIALMSLGMQSGLVMAQVAPASGPAAAEGPTSGAARGVFPNLSCAGLLISLLAFAAAFARLWGGGLLDGWERDAAVSSDFYDQWKRWPEFSQASSCDLFPFGLNEASVRCFRRMQRLSFCRIKQNNDDSRS
jgi:hypothetical protein